MMEIPLEAFKLFRQFNPIESIHFSGNLKGTFYLDDFRLVAVQPPQPNTAVLEDHTATLPQSFTLSQNYPNPFNSSTVIRFALPTTDRVELTLYNLAGQKVATPWSKAPAKPAPTPSAGTDRIPRGAPWPAACICIGCGRTRAGWKRASWCCCGERTTGLVILSGKA